MPREKDVTAVVIAPFKGADGRYRTKEGELYICSTKDFQRLSQAGCLTEATQEDIELQKAIEEDIEEVLENEGEEEGEKEEGDLEDEE